MLYIICIYNTNGNGFKSYNLFESHTESTIEISEEELKKLINLGLDIKGIRKRSNGSIGPARWVHSIRTSNIGENTGARFILLGKCSDGTYKLVENTGKVTYDSDTTLRHRLNQSDIANCRIVRVDGKETIQALDTIPLSVTKEFEQHIENEYKKFILKTSALGLDNNFQYTIEDYDVRIDKYKGTSKRVIIPNFITAIRENAFYNKELEQVTFNDRLKFIGNEAFSINYLQSCSLPESLEIVFFYSFRKSGARKILSESTIILGES